MNARVLVNGHADARIAANDRGLLYGDGLFETILFARGQAPLWPRHMQRLLHGCERLLLPAPEIETLAREAAQVVAESDRAVVRITLTRGGGARGYVLPNDVECTRIVAAFDPPFTEPDWYARGIRVRFGDLALSAQPRLAGIKHLNRLEQVLARAEWNDPAIAESLLFDEQDRLIGATAANVFVARGGELITPALDRCGVAGVARAEIIEALNESIHDSSARAESGTGPDSASRRRARSPRGGPSVARVGLRTDVQIREIGREELMQADEVFLSSSVRGILPVRELTGRSLECGPFARALQAHWRGLGLMEIVT